MTSLSSCSIGTQPQPWLETPPPFDPAANLRPELHRAPLVRLSPPLPSVRVSVGVPVIVGVGVPVVVGVSVVHFFLKGDVGLGAPLARSVKHPGVVLVAVISVGVAVISVAVVAVSVVAVRMAVSRGRVGRQEEECGCDHGQC